jgi:hypothetical protein
MEFVPKGEEEIMCTNRPEPAGSKLRRSIKEEEEEHQPIGLNSLFQRGKCLLGALEKNAKEIKFCK